MQKALDFLSAKDAILKQIIDRFGAPIVQKRAEGFASMCHIILEQQVSIASAKACYLKIETLFGSITPEIIATASDEDLRSCGVSRQKTIYLKDLAAKVISHYIDFDSFANKTEEQVRGHIKKLGRSYKFAKKTNGFFNIFIFSTRGIVITL